jgi:hypothetical protein
LARAGIAHFGQGGVGNPGFATGIPVVEATITYFVSLCSVCLRQRLQYFDSFSFSALARLFLVLE